MRYIIMANGEGRRWGNYLNTSKHLALVDGKSVLENTVALLNEYAPGEEIVLSSRWDEYDFLGVERFVPLRAEYEFDRFCIELVSGPTCFLYGDTYYTPALMKQIVEATPDPYLFFGTRRSIVALKFADGNVLRKTLREMHEKIERGEIKDGKGWQLYHYLLGMPLEGKELGEAFCLVTDESTDFNTPGDYNSFLKNHARS